MTSDPRHVRYTGRAFRYVTMLSDLGHLEGGLAERVAVTAAEIYGDDRTEVLVDLPQIRRVVALVLFDHGIVQDGGLTAPLDEDWPMLFH